MFPTYCVESGDLLTFVGGKDERDAALSFVFRIMSIKGATLGETVVVREDHRGKQLAKFTTEDLLSPFSDRPDIKLRKEKGRILFTKVPIPRRSCFEAWQGVFRKDEPLVRLRKCHWIARGFVKNPIS